MAKGDKYKVLTEYLINSNKDKLTLTFEELEEITGGLPSYVYDYKVAWSDENQHSLSYGWLRAGYSIEEDFENKKATFIKIRDVSKPIPVDDLKSKGIENKPNWMPFYKEMAIKLLDYIDKRDELMEKMQFNKLLESCGLDLRVEEEDIDPFTIYALANRRIHEHLKIDILMHYASVLGIKAKFPTNFEGIPDAHNQSTLFYAYENKKEENDIENLWQLFKSALEYANKKNENTMTNFSKWLDITILQPMVGTSKISAGLFWIAPDTFLSLDKISCGYINILEYEELNSIKNTLNKLPEKGLRGHNYIPIIDEMKKFIESPKSPFKDFIDFSSKAFVFFKNKEKLTKEEKEKEEEHANFDNITRGYNKIYYGLPGCGKSYKIENEILKDVVEENKIRVTFHQDYSYSDFIGQIMPKINEDKTVTYEFVSGPFIKAIGKALINLDRNIYLIIEEINRGNAPSIFGDTFQLLDRNEYGESEFPITNDLVIEYLSGNIDRDKLYIPSNLIILATMNTSDQNVFTLDTAFKRRWDFEEVTNDFTDENHPYGLVYVPRTNITWTTFYERINEEIINKSNFNFGFEDKRIGAFFIKKDTLSEIENNQDKDLAAKFSYKMLEYLWNDVCKFDKQILFESNYRTLSEVIKGFLNLENPLSIFNFRFNDAE